MTKLSKAEEDAISKLLDRTQELIQLGKIDEAKVFLDEILKYKPNEFEAHFQKGLLFLYKGDDNEAIKYFSEVSEKWPAFERFSQTGMAYQNLRRFDDAIEWYQKSIEKNLISEQVLTAIANCYYRQGNFSDGIQAYRNLLIINPRAEHAHSNILLMMVYAEHVTPEELAEEAKAFGSNIEKIYTAKAEFKNDRDKNRKLRIGYISPDFRNHSIPYFLESVFQNRDADNFEIYAYSSTKEDNPVMERLKGQVDFWRDIRKMKVEEICSLVERDQIDILVDLSGHTGYNHLDVFACKPAPIQVTWLGYPATTGLKTIDYRITDFYAEPPGVTEHLNTETLWRLPNIFCCYKPDKNPDVIDHPPFEDNGYITFGCFNNFIKVSNSVLAAWSRILEQVPHSRLLLEVADIVDNPSYFTKIKDRIQQNNISLDRVIFEPQKKSNQFVLYNKIDIALDPFPCNGGTTSMDTLWMGVPFVTLAGRHFVSRMGVTILTNAGLPELIADNVDDYVSIAVNLAADKERLKSLRHNLRDRFSKSPAMDQKRFARDMEEAYRAMWIKYCDAMDSKSSNEDMVQ